MPVEINQTRVLFFFAFFPSSPFTLFKIAQLVLRKRGERVRGKRGFFLFLYIYYFLTTILLTCEGREKPSLSSHPSRFLDVQEWISTINRLFRMGGVRGFCR